MFELFFLQKLEVPSPLIHTLKYFHHLLRFRRVIGPGTTDLWEKNQRLKISCYCPFKEIASRRSLKCFCWGCSTYVCSFSINLKDPPIICIFSLYAELICMYCMHIITVHSRTLHCTVHTVQYSTYCTVQYPLSENSHLCTLHKVVSFGWANFFYEDWDSFSLNFESSFIVSFWIEDGDSLSCQYRDSIFTVGIYQMGS